MVGDQLRFKVKIGNSFQFWAAFDRNLMHIAKVFTHNICDSWNISFQSYERCYPVLTYFALPGILFYKNLEGFTLIQPEKNLWCQADLRMGLRIRTTFFRSYLKHCLHSVDLIVHLNFYLKFLSPLSPCFNSVDLLRQHKVAQKTSQFFIFSPWFSFQNSRWAMCGWS